MTPAAKVATLSVLVALVGGYVDSASGISMGQVDLSSYDDDLTLELSNSFYFGALHPDVDRYLNELRDGYSWTSGSYNETITHSSHFEVPMDTLVSVDYRDSRINYKGESILYNAGTSNAVKTHVIINYGSPDYLLIKNVPTSDLSPTVNVSLKGSCPEELQYTKVVNEIRGETDTFCTADEENLAQSSARLQFWEMLPSIGAGPSVDACYAKYPTQMRCQASHETLVFIEPVLGITEISHDVEEAQPDVLVYEFSKNAAFIYAHVYSELRLHASYAFFGSDSRGYALFGGDMGNIAGDLRSVEFHDLASRHMVVYMDKEVDTAAEKMHEYIRSKLVDVIDDFDDKVGIQEFKEAFQAEYAEGFGDVPVLERPDGFTLEVQYGFTNNTVGKMLESESELRIAQAVIASMDEEYPKKVDKRMLNKWAELEPAVKSLDYRMEWIFGKAVVEDYSSEKVENFMKSIVYEETTSTGEFMNEVYGGNFEYGASAQPPVDETVDDTAEEDTPRQDVQVAGGGDASDGVTDEPSTGGCLIATAAYGTELAPQVQFLREIRDTTLLSTASGASFMTGFNQVYYSFSPAIADLERENPMFRDMVRAAITPAMYTLNIMTLADPGSDASVLVFGILSIGAIGGIYVAGPYMTARAISRKAMQRRGSNC